MYNSRHLSIQSTTALVITTISDPKRCSIINSQPWPLLTENWMGQGEYFLCPMFPSFWLKWSSCILLALLPACFALKQFHPCAFSLKPNRKNSKSLWNCSKFRLQRAKSSLILLLRRLLPPTDSEKCHCHLLRFRVTSPPICPALKLSLFLSSLFGSCRLLHCDTWTVFFSFLFFFFILILAFGSKGKKIPY